MNDDFTLDFDLPDLFADVDGAEEPPAKVAKRRKFQHCTEGIHSRCIRRREETVLRRAFSESKLLDILDHDLLDGHSYHCITGGDVDSLSFLKVVLRQQPLDYLLFSTWCMADDDILQFRQWLDQKKIGRMDAYVGEIFPGTYRHEYTLLKQLMADHGGRVCVFRNHSKIYAGIGPKFAFAIESSANINTNPRTENGNIIIGSDIYAFYKEFFDGVKSFTNDFADWQPYRSTP